MWFAEAAAIPNAVRNEKVRSNLFAIKKYYSCITHCIRQLEFAYIKKCYIVIKIANLHFELSKVN